MARGRFSQRGKNTGVRAKIIAAFLFAGQPTLTNVLGCACMTASPDFLDDLRTITGCGNRGVNANALQHAGHAAL